MMIMLSAACCLLLKCYAKGYLYDDGSPVVAVVIRFRRSVIGNFSNLLAIGVIIRIFLVVTKLVDIARYRLDLACSFWSSIRVV